MMRELKDILRAVCLEKAACHLLELGAWEHGEREHSLLMEAGKSMIQYIDPELFNGMGP